MIRTGYSECQALYHLLRQMEVPEEEWPRILAEACGYAILDLTEPGQEANDELTEYMKTALGAASLHGWP